jgi:hypothetical protein
MDLELRLEKIDLVRRDADLKKHQVVQSEDGESSSVHTETTCTMMSSSTSMASLNYQHTRKRVRFATDTEGNVLCHELENKEPPMTEDEIEASWCSPTEFKLFRRLCRKEVRTARKTTYRTDFRKLYTACEEGDVTSVMQEKQAIANSSCRGLELLIFPDLHSDRKTAIRTIIRTQKALPVCLTAEHREKALASVSRFLSKQTRQLSHLLGTGDAAVARTIHNE